MLDQSAMSKQSPQSIKIPKVFFFHILPVMKALGTMTRPFFLFLIFQNLNFSIFTGIESPECAHNFIDIDV